MPATTFFADAEYEDSAQSALPESLNLQQLRFDRLNDEADQAMEDFGDEETDYVDPAALRKLGSRRTTDLVRLYLQEIGRVRLLGRDEEVSEAQRVQRYMRFVELRNQAAIKEDGVLKRYVQLINTHDYLASHLSHRPSLERWATEANIAVSDL